MHSAKAINASHCLNWIALNTRPSRLHPHCPYSEWQSTHRLHIMGLKIRGYSQNLLFPSSLSPSSPCLPASLPPSGPRSPHPSPPERPQLRSLFLCTPQIQMMTMMVMITETVSELTCSACRVHGDFLFFFILMLFNERHAGGEDRPALKS